MNKKVIFIQGMHCTSCEKLLDSEFRNISGVKEVKINYQAGQAEIFYQDNEPTWEKIKEITEKYGYNFSQEKPKKSSGNYKIVNNFKNNWRDWAGGGIIALLIILVFKQIQSWEVFQGVRLGQDEMAYGMAVLIGVAASLSSCLAVVGAVIISFAEKYQSGDRSFYQAAVKPNLYFQIGRLVTFFLLGGILGVIGGGFNLQTNFLGVFTVFIAMVMAWLGLNILGLVPSISNLGLRMPSVFTKKWSALRQSNHRFAPFLLGGLTFFLPCGFTQSMQLFALGSGSFFTGAMAMFLFAFGTVPVLLTVGITAAGTKESKFGAFKKAAGILVIIFAISIFNSGQILASYKTGAAYQPDLSTASDFQIVRMSITANGFEPSAINIKKGMPVKWIINGDGATSCTNRIIIPSLGVSTNIHPGDNEVEFKIDNAGIVPFSCWMGMVRGKFVVK